MNRIGLRIQISSRKSKKYAAAFSPISNSFVTISQGQDFVKDDFVKDDFVAKLLIGIDAGKQEKAYKW